MPRSPKAAADCPTGVIARIEALRAIAIEADAELPATIAKALTDRSPTVRADALDLARKHQLKMFETQALRSLAHTNQFVLYSAIQYLGWLHVGEKISATFLYPLLNDRRPLVRVEILETLEQIGDRSALDLIAARLGDEDALVRSYAAMMLAEMNARRFRKRVARVASTEMLGHIQAHFARALFVFGDPQYFARLIELLRADHYLSRCAAANSLNSVYLDEHQLKVAVQAVSFARTNYIARADQNTMEKVEAELRNALSEFAAERSAS